MSVGAIGAEILGGEGGIHPSPPWYTSLKHPMVLGLNVFYFTKGHPNVHVDDSPSVYFLDKFIYYTFGTT